MTFTAGQKLRASDLNEGFELTRYAAVAADVNKVSSTAMSDITGLSFELDANSEYLMDGFVPYYSLTGVDVAFAFTGPAGMTVSWTPYGGPIGNATFSGDLDFFCAETYGDGAAFPLNTDSAAALACLPHGFWRTGATAGTLQMRFAQNTSSAATLAIKRGAWLRLHKVA